MLTGVRTILVPPDIVPVRRVSPLPVKKRTVWRQRPEGDPVERAGREWFSDQLFVESRTTHRRALCGSSLTIHASCVIGVILVMATQSGPVRLVKVGSPLVMPMMMSLMPIAEAAGPAAKPSKPAAPKPVPQPALASPPQAVTEEIAAPPEAPSAIEPEAGIERRADATEGGVDGGVAGGSGGGPAGGAGGGAPAGGSSPGPLRLSAGMDPPRKIKDVKPIYPQGALSGQARGTVIIEATVGVDGMVQDAKVINSVPLLDQAALDAVRQWEFIPARLKGAPIAVIITVIVQFAIY